MLKAFFLDVKKQTLSPLLLDPLRLLDGLYTNIGCKVVEMVVEDNLTVWIDEEALSKAAPFPKTMTFSVDSGPWLEGNVIFLGPIDDDGEVTDIQIPIQALAYRITPTPEVVE